MPHEWLFAISSVVLVSLVSLIGAIAIAISDLRLRQIIFVLVSLATGAMFGDAFIHLLPEAFQHDRPSILTSLLVLAGIFAFFTLEKFLRWRHAHRPAEGRIHTLGYMNLVADGVHNLMDGVLIGASYAAGPRVGITTTLAVLLHEIPQELGDFGILIHAGFSKGRALLFNFLSATLAIGGAVLSLLASTRVTDFSEMMLPLTAGGFIYIAGADLMPELQSELKPSKSLVQLGAMLTGVALMLALTAMD
jgi:zinc and cadmium transporter